MLASPLTYLILRALAGGPMKQAELRRATGTPAQTTLRAQLRRLVEIGAIEKHRRNRFPGVLEYELTSPGGELLFVSEVLDRWLAMGPEGPLHLGDGPAKAAVKALAEGWSTTIVRALAAGSLSLTELDGVIASLNYPSLERRLAAMRLAGLVESVLGNGRGTPYAVTAWLRQGVAPIAAATRWERRHVPKSAAPLGRLDAEAIFLLALPPLRLAADLSGSCRIAAEIPGARGKRLAGVTARVEAGQLTSCSTELRGSPDAWALSSASVWLDALVEGDLAKVELGGDCRLARSFLDGMHAALFLDGHPAST